jgi:nicotinamidase-related amidase
MRGHATAFFGRRPVADAVDASGSPHRDGVGKPPSRAHGVHPFYPADAGDRYAGNVAAFITRVGKLQPANNWTPRFWTFCRHLGTLCPPANVIDKTRYSGFMQRQLFEHLQSRAADGLATVLGAVDLGYRVIGVRDAVCSSSDEGHDSLMTLYHQRYAEQIEVADAVTILERWEP